MLRTLRCVFFWTVGALYAGSLACNRGTTLTSGPHDSGTVGGSDARVTSTDGKDADTSGGAGSGVTSRGGAGAGGTSGAGPPRLDSGLGGVDTPVIQTGGGDAAGTGGTTESIKERCNFGSSGLVPFAPTGPNHVFLLVGDLDGDGKPDVVSANWNDPSVTVLLAKGNGRFSPGKEYAVTEPPSGIALVDVNGDGRLDIVTEDDAPVSTVSVLLGKGDGTFAAAVDSSARYGATYLEVGDVDGDGKLDLVTESMYLPGVVSVLLGKGDGRFVLGEATYSVASGLRGGLVLGDFNGDGRADLVAFSGTVNVVLATGDGEFDAGRELACAGYVSTGVVGDFNGDGNLDIATSSTGSSDADVVCVLHGRGDGTFADPVISPRTGDVSVTKDMNGDGKLDLVTDSALLLGKGDGTFVESAALPGGSNSRRTVADMNGDGRPDIAMPVGDGPTSAVSVLLQGDDGMFGPDLVLYPADTGAKSVVLGDLNGDGKLDVVTANDTSVSVLLGKGGGSFAGKADYSVGGTPAILLLGDVNADGKLDIVTEVPGGVLLGKGDGTFSAKADGGKGIGGTSLALGDVNGDGKLDLVEVTYEYMMVENGVVSVRLGIGDGGFAAQTNYQVGLNPDGVALGDVNGDGKLDIVVSNLGLDDDWSMSVLLGAGDGTFTAGQGCGCGGSPRWVTLADLNGDGKLDIIDSTFTVSLGNGDGTFVHPVQAMPGYSADSVAFSDIDGDGMLDVVLASSDANTLQVAFGKGDGTFGSTIGYTVGAAGLALGDLNGDGVPDIVATKPGADSVFALRPSCP